MDRIIMHIDVNSAFLSWSAIKMLKEGSKVDLRNEISVVSGEEASRHGIVVAASIPAKKIGIHSPMNLHFYSIKEHKLYLEQEENKNIKYFSDKFIRLKNLIGGFNDIEKLFFL